MLSIDGAAVANQRLGRLLDRDSIGQDGAVAERAVLVPAAEPVVEAALVEDVVAVEGAHFFLVFNLLEANHTAGTAAVVLVLMMTTAWHNGRTNQVMISDLYSGCASSCLAHHVLKACVLHARSRLSMRLFWPSVLERELCDLIRRGRKKAVLRNNCQHEWEIEWKSWHARDDQYQEDDGKDDGQQDGDSRRRIFALLGCLVRHGEKCGLVGWGKEGRAGDAEAAWAKGLSCTQKRTRGLLDRYTVEETELNLYTRYVAHVVWQPSSWGHKSRVSPERLPRDGSGQKSLDYADLVLDGRSGSAASSALFVAAPFERGTRWHWLSLQKICERAAGSAAQSGCGTGTASR